MSRPTCAACGKGLAKFVSTRGFTIPADPRKHPCITDPSAWRKASPPPEMTADGMPPTRGRLGDNLVCGMACGYRLAIRLVSCDPGILRLLPPAHDPEKMAAEAAARRREKSRARREARRDRKKKPEIAQNFI